MASDAARIMSEAGGWMRKQQDRCGRTEVRNRGARRGVRVEGRIAFGAAASSALWPCPCAALQWIVYSMCLRDYGARHQWLGE